MSQWPTFYHVCRVLARGLRDCPDGKEPEFVVTLTRDNGETVEIRTREFRAGMHGVGCYPGAPPHYDVSASFGNTKEGVTFEWHLLERGDGKDFPKGDNPNYKPGADKKAVVLALAEYLRSEKVWTQGPDPNPFGTAPGGFNFKCEKVSSITHLGIKIEHIAPPAPPRRKRRLVVSESEEEEEEEVAPTEWVCQKCERANPETSRRCSECIYPRDKKRVREE